MATTLISRILILCFVCGCSTPPSLWTIDCIAAGNRSFDSSRLRYNPLQSHPPLAFEMVKIGDQIESYLSLTRFRLKSAEHAIVHFKIADQSFEDLIPIHEGGMRLHIPQETTRRIIQALQEGHKISILLDDFEETLNPNQFSGSFAKFIGEGYFFRNFFKGPMQ